METHLCESQSAEADNNPCNGKDAKAKKESENDESIQQTSRLTKGGGSLGFHTLIQISYILLYTSSFMVKI